MSLADNCVGRVHGRVRERIQGFHQLGENRFHPRFKHRPRNPDRGRFLYTLFPDPYSLFFDACLFGTGSSAIGCANKELEPDCSF